VSIVTGSVANVDTARLKMSSEELAQPSQQSDLLNQILATVQSIQQNYIDLSATIGSIQGQVNVLAGVKQVRDVADDRSATTTGKHPSTASKSNDQHIDGPPATGDSLATSPVSQLESLQETLRDGRSSTKRKPGGPSISRIILTTYPNQSGIDPLNLDWGHKDPLQRGPVVVSRNQSTIRRRNGVLSIPLSMLEILTSILNSDWRTWRLIFYLPCISRCQQEFRR